MTELASGWVETTLGDVCDVILGQSPPGSAYNSDGLGLPFFQGKAEFGPMYPTTRIWTTAGSKIAREGDTLISVRAPVGPTNLAPFDCVIGRGLAALRPSTVTTTRFVLYQMRATQGELASVATGSTFSAVSGEQLRQHRFVLPPRSEQERIVAAIEEQFSQLDHAETLLRHVRRKLIRLRDVVITSAFAAPWPLVRLSEIVDIVSGQTPPGIATSSTATIPYYKVGDMNLATGRVMGRSREYLDLAAIAKFRLHVRPIGTVIFPKRGGAIATNKKRILATPAVFDLNTMGLVPGEGVEPRFLLNWLETIDLARLADGSTVPQINYGDVRSIEIPLPPKEQQIAVIEVLESKLSVLESVAETIERGFARSKMLRRASLVHAFSGGLLPQRATGREVPLAVTEVGFGRSDYRASEG